nr:hypothetical protein [uncultured Anaerocolumna sp.]
MSSKAEELLSKLKAEYESSQTKYFDSMFYIGYDDSVLIELHNEGYINIVDDVVGSIELLVE